GVQVSVLTCAPLKLKSSIARPSSLPPSSGSCQRITRVCPGAQVTPPTVAETCAWFAASLPLRLMLDPPVFGAVKFKPDALTNVALPSAMLAAPTAYEKLSVLAAAVPRRHCSPVN